MQPVNWWSRTREKIWSGLLADRSIYVAALAYFVACGGYVVARGAFDSGQLIDTVRLYADMWWREYGVLFPLFLVEIGVIHVLLRLKERRRLGFRMMLGPERSGRLIAGSVLLLIMVPFHTSFNLIKNMIPLGQGFPFDHVFADFDKALFFGHDPFTLLYAIGKQEWLLRVIELNYGNGWIIVTFGTLYWMAVSPRHDSIRSRYFVSFILSWAIVGNVLATIFSSAGPIYYGYVTGDFARFGDQVAFLETTVDAMGSSAMYQHYLWSLHLAGQPGLASGISAFPSMHLALVTLNALFIGEFKPKWAKWAWMYVAIIEVSSVYLGWHYAVDGFASIAIVFGIYWAVRRVMTSRLVWTRQRTEADTGVVAAD